MNGMSALIKAMLWWIFSGYTGMVTARLHPQKLHNRQFNFNITIPAGMAKVTDSSLAGEQVFYDTSSAIILMISAKKSEFKSVDDYLNCTHSELEQQLKLYGDTTLKLISCGRSQYYPEKTTVLHFRVYSLPFDYDTYLIYFIHHRHKDIQISFTYKQVNERKSLEYINGVMQTLTLIPVL